MTPEEVQAHEQQVARLIGQRLRQMRERQGLTLREVAQRLGFRHHSIILKYEQGTIVPTVARLFSLAHVLNCSASALLAHEEQAMDLIATIDQADTTARAQLVFMVETLGTASVDFGLGEVSHES